jgi:hypothetical protein
VSASGSADGDLDQRRDWHKRPCSPANNHDAVDLFTIAGHIDGHPSYRRQECPPQKVGGEKTRRRDGKREVRAPCPQAKAVAAPVVTLKAGFEQLGEAHGLPKKQAQGLLADFVAAMTTHLKHGDRIRMSDLHPGGQNPGCPHGPQPGERRDHSDQGQQEGKVSAGQGTQGSNLGDSHVPPGASP